ncbi:tumor protein D54-like isoform X2 [Anneissia japonica]|uniref:tumor protein D54-like isoform X2 n=1 Tax=Anneissia japonica TaxID=1529436 RepID=UPI0014259BD4|nr:tumor protein D54-like isoform X2 [Anneissia japonica]
MLNGELESIEEGYGSADERPSDERMRSASAINYQTYLQIVPTDIDDEDEENIFFWDEPTLSSPDSTPVYGDTPTDPANEFPQDPNYQDPYVVQNEEEREKIRLELAQTEEDIAALRSTLRGKEQAAKELKRKLGITTMSEVKKDVAQGWKNIQQSNAYVNTSNKLHEINERITTSSAYNKTKTGLSTAGQKTGAAFSTLGSSISKKLGEMKESTAFKSFESKVSNASGNIKNKLTGSKSEDLSTFEETLNTTVKEEQVNADGSSTKTDSGTPLPEEKVPL